MVSLLTGLVKFAANHAGAIVQETNCSRIAKTPAKPIKLVLQRNNKAIAGTGFRKAAKCREQNLSLVRSLIGCDDHSSSAFENLARFDTRMESWRGARSGVVVRTFVAPR
jgi:hypothetical protein